MDRRFLFPAFAVTAWAQQQPAPVASEAEQALRVRVAQFYQLQVDKKFRQSETIVAEDSKDDFYNSAKPDIRDFSIADVQLSDNNTRAKVTIKGKFRVTAPFGSQVFEMAAVSFWKIENGQWAWYVNREAAASPFGKINAASGASKGGVPSSIPIDVAGLMNQVTLDRTSVSLTGAEPVQTVSVSNNLAGPIQLTIESPVLEGVSVAIENAEVKPGENGTIRFRLEGKVKRAAVVRLAVSPINKTFEIQVNSN